MHLYTIRFPGSDLDEPQAPDAKALISLMVSSLEEATIALDLYEQFQRERRDPIGIGSPGEANMRRALEILKEREKTEPGFDFDHALKEVNREQYLADRGRPIWYFIGRGMIVARSFVYALDTLRSAADALTSDPSMSARARPAYDAFVQAMPDLRHVRNSAHHQEDRVRLLKPGGKKIQIVPTTIDDGRNRYSFDGLTSNVDLCGKLAFTKADGKTGAVNVSAAALGQAATCVQGIVNALRWTGRFHYLPY